MQVVILAQSCGKSDHPHFLSKLTSMLWLYYLLSMFLPIYSINIPCHYHYIIVLLCCRLIMSLFLTYMFVLNFHHPWSTMECNQQAAWTTNRSLLVASRVRPFQIIKKYLQCTWILTVSGTRGVGRQNRGPRTTPPRLH